MNRFLLPASAALLCVALFLSPLVAAYPDDTTPQQTLWSSALSACVFLSAVLWGLTGQKNFPSNNGRAGLVFAALVTWTGVSVLARLLTQHSIAFLGPMLRGFATWALYGTVFALCVQMARQGKTYFYGLVGTVLAASAWAATIGLNEYIQHVKAGEHTWRVFGTSTPDFLAAYFVLAIPLTLAVLLRLPSGKELNSPLLGVALPGLIALVLLTQAATLVETGSRFALVSVVVGMGVFLLTLLFAVRRGFVLDKAARVRLTVLAVVVLAAVAVAARPIYARLTVQHESSGAFRVWTWRGATRMASANPVAGAGVGTWQDTYPQYALVGFTRLAHNSFLQMADECGVPGLLLLILTLGAVARAGIASSRREAGTQARETLVDPLLQCGLLGAVAGGIVQNLIDSDWYVFFFGVAFWAMAGLLAGLAGQKAAETVPARPLPRLLLTGGAAVACAYFVTQTVAANYAAQGRNAQSPQDAQTLYALAQTWDTLNAKHHTDMAARVYAPVGNYPAAEAEIRKGVQLLPSAGNYLRLARVLVAQDKTADALAACNAGLRADPNSLDLLLQAARLAPQDENYYRRMAVLEVGPVGTVRAIGELTEAKFAFADAALGLYARAARILEAYAEEGGSANYQRQAMQSNQTDPAQDKELRDLYVHVMDGLARTSPPAAQPALAAERQKTLALYDKLLAPPPK